MYKQLYAIFKNNNFEFREHFILIMQIIILPTFSTFQEYITNSYLNNYDYFKKVFFSKWYYS